MAERTDLLVIGAGPYAYSAAACARDRGIDTWVVGLPMSFWREQMPADMYLRSGPDWHLDTAGEHTFAAYFEDRGLSRAEHDPVPIGVFLDHTDWFREQKGFDVDERLVDTVEADDTGAFVATMEDGSTITAEKVLAAPGIRHFVTLPAWHEGVPEHRRAHTVDLVDFDALAGARVVVVGGRQSAYEWAALLCDHGAASVDVVHRHPAPAFERVSWEFVDPYVEQTLAQRGWWRSLTADEQRAIALEFWQVGRLTLEPWLTPRLRPDVVTVHPSCEVVDVEEGDEATLLGLTDGSRLTADFVVFASGYRADIGRVPYLEPVLDALAVTDGFPQLSEGFETSVPGLFITGFASTRDFGPFYGFTKGCPSSASLAVAEMLR
ncbi:MAG TPA: FAD-dependent oxidoreductase [Ornithinibacter sp.]|nr:FAD-dependent oxidoreductase [Ornithinibacter sp.]